MPESRPALSEDLRGLAAFLSSEIGPRCAHEAVREVPSITPLGPMGVGRSAIMPLQLVELQQSQQSPESNTGWVGGDTMAEFDDRDRGREDRRDGLPDRRVSQPNPWANPAIWISLCSLLLVVFGSVLGFLIAQLSSINTAQQAILITTTEQKRDMKALDDRLTKAENAVTTIEKAYIYNLNHRLTYVEAKTGVKAPSAKQE